MRTLLPLALVCLVCAGTPAPTLFGGEALPPGPSWTTSWMEAKETALATGRPIFAYFTKKH